VEKKYLSNSLVDSIYKEKEEKERFMREAERSRFYRAGLHKMIDREIEALVLAEESGDDPVTNVAMRKALRHLKRCIEIGGFNE
jgi:hypothetical protein